MKHISLIHKELEMVPTQVKQVKMGKAALTPLYISAVWVLLISYQLFTQIAVVSVVSYINVIWPSTLSEWFISHQELIIFIHGFAWVFVLSSVIPSVLLGRERSVIIQFAVCLILTLVSISLRDLLPIFHDGQISNQILNLSKRTSKENRKRETNLSY